jgi:hypothetical protein
MTLVYVGKLCTTKAGRGHFAKIKQRHVLPIAVCDFVGTVGTPAGGARVHLFAALRWRLRTPGTTVGLEYAGSAIFGIIYSSVTVCITITSTATTRQQIHVPRSLVDALTDATAPQVWAAIFTCWMLRRWPTRVNMLGIATCLCGLLLPTIDVIDDSGGTGEAAEAAQRGTFGGPSLPPTAASSSSLTECRKTRTLRKSMQGG